MDSHAIGSVIQKASKSRTRLVNSKQRYKQMYKFGRDSPVKEKYNWADA